MLSFIIFLDQPEDKTITSSEPSYELATHTVKVRRTGTLADVSAIWDLSGEKLYKSLTQLAHHCWKFLLSWF